MKRLKRQVTSVCAAVLVTCALTTASNAATSATMISADVKSDGHYAYLAQVWAKNTAYKKANSSEASFKAQLRYVEKGKIRQRVTGKKVFFGNKQKTYANSPTAAWPYNNCRAAME